MKDGSMGFSQTVRIVGVDCATDARNVGLAFATWHGGVTTIIDVSQGGADNAALENRIFDWITLTNEPVLLALDAPLGWPLGMRDALEEHRAGEEVRILPNTMFRRETDRAIKRAYKKTSLDIGADRIARSAHAALALLGRLRNRLDEPIHLAWTSAPMPPYSAIEVYPSATLLGHGIGQPGYRKPDATDARQELFGKIRNSLVQRVQIQCAEEKIVASPHLIDALLCALAATDFLDGRAQGPDAEQLATFALVEGWIWAPMKTP